MGRWTCGQRSVFAFGLETGPKLVCNFGMVRKKCLLLDLLPAFDPLLILDQRRLDARVLGAGTC